MKIKNQNNYQDNARPAGHRADLYPEDYDLDIVFESKENRKNRKLMGKRHVEGLIIETRKDE